MTLSETGTPGTIPDTLTAGLGANSTTAGQIRVVWDASTDMTVSGYTLRFEIGHAVARDIWAWPGIWNLCPLPALGVDSTGFTHRDLQAWRRYRYQVQATNPHGDSEWSTSFPPSGVTPVPNKAAAGDVSVEPSEQSSEESEKKWEVEFIVLECSRPPCEQEEFEPFPDPDSDPDLPPDSGPAFPIDFEVQVNSGGVLGAYRLASPFSGAPGGGASGARGASSDGATATSVRVEAAGDTVRVSGLADTVVHQIRVRLVNADGVPGEASDSLAVVPLRAQAGDGQGTLSWDSPGHDRLEEWQYRQRRGIGSWGDWQDVTGSMASTTSHTVTGLANGEVYGFQVRGVYELAAGSYRAGAVSFSRQVTLPDVPNAPVDLEAEEGDAQVTLTWQTPADNGSPLTGYEYRQSSDGGGTWSPDWGPVPGSDGSTTSHTPMGLTNDTEYTFEVRAVNGAGEGASASDTATPERPDTRGRVEWSTNQPRVGQELTPTLIDPDNPVLAEARWRWRRQRWSRSDDGDSLSAPVPGSRSGESKLGVIARTRQYTPRVSDLHQWLWVEVTYTDDFDRHRVSATTSRAVGPGPPCAPANLKAAPGDGQVTLTWEAGCNNGGTIARYQYRRLDAVKWVRVPGDGSARRQQVEGLTNGEAHTFEVRAGNRQEWGPAAEATATPAAAESPPPPPPPPLTVTYGASSYSAQEGGEAATVTVRLSASASEALSIPITVNPPSGDFTVAGLTDGALSFAPEADEATFTITADQDDDTVDETVLLGFGDLPEEVSAGTPASATVTLFDDDVGTPVVSLSTTTPQVGRGMTATLVDGDGYLTAVTWQWQRRADGSSAWETLERTARYPITDLSRYTPVAADVGKQLRATVSYTDAHGASKSVQSAATDAVTWPPLTVTYGDSTYSASEGGAAATLTVRLSAEAEQLVKIPITRDPASGDYTVTWPGVEDTLSFSGSTTSQSFTVTATEDDDEDDETVLLGFGDLPERVEAGTPASATVTLVDDTDHLGTVSLSTASPQVGRGMTATLVDGDGYLTAVTWQWQRRADGSSAWETLERTARYPITDLSRYTPVAADAGKQLRATVSYTDAHGPDSAQSAATDAVTWPPLTVAYGDSTYSASEGGAAATLTVRLSAEAEQLVKIPITRDPASGDYTVTWPGVEDTLSFSGSTTSQSFTVTATEDDDEDDETVLVGFGALPERVEAGTPASATVTLVDDTDHPGTVRLSTSSPEVGTEVTATLVDLDGYLSGLNWQWQRRADASSAWVDIEGSGARTPITATSRYTPVTADRGQQLRATVGYTDGHGSGKSAQSAATSAVRKADTPGTVRLSTSSPEVGTEVTATLVDLDGYLSGLNWQWQRRADASSAWVDIEGSGARTPITATSRYTPVTADRGQQLRATVGYTDGHGSGKSAQSAATSAVRKADTPGTVRLSTSSPEVGTEVTATLVDLDGYLSGLNWQWQRRADASSAWVDIEGSGARTPITATSRYTPVTADRGQQLRATVGYTDGHGSGKSAQSAATSAVRKADTPRHGALVDVVAGGGHGGDGHAGGPRRLSERAELAVAAAGRREFGVGGYRGVGGAHPHYGHVPLHAGDGGPGAAAAGHGRVHRRARFGQERAECGDVGGEEGGHPRHGALVDVVAGGGHGGDGHAGGPRRLSERAELAVAAAGRREFGVGAYRAVGALPHCGHVPLHADDVGCGQAAAGHGRLHRRPRSGQERAERRYRCGEGAEPAAGHRRHRHAVRAGEHPVRSHLHGHGPGRPSHHLVRDRERLPDQ